jgi:protein-disulfide isomerase
MRRVGAGIGALGVLLAIGGCQAAHELDAIREQSRQVADRQRELQTQQQEIEKRLTKLEEGQQKLLEEGTRSSRPTVQEDFDRVHAIHVGNSPVRGNPNATVTIVEFSDFQCPYCAGSVPVFKQVLTQYGDNVRLVFKHFPLSFHSRARPAARAALAAQEQGRFWEMHDLLFEHVRDLDESEFPALAAKAGLDVERFRRSYETKRTEYEGQIDADRTLQGISAMIDEELRGASSLEGKGL